MNCGGNTLDLLTATRAASPSRWESLDKMVLRETKERLDKLVPKETRVRLDRT